MTLDTAQMKSCFSTTSSCTNTSSSVKMRLQILESTTWCFKPERNTVWGQEHGSGQDNSSMMGEKCVISKPCLEVFLSPEDFKVQGTLCTAGLSATWNVSFL